MADISDKMAVDPYVLAATLAGHEQDVRAVGPFGTDAILTGSRDASIMHRDTRTPQEKLSPVMACCAASAPRSVRRRESPAVLS